MCCSPWGGRVWHDLATEQQQMTENWTVVVQRDPPPSLIFQTLFCQATNSSRKSKVKMLPHYCFILHFYYSQNGQLYCCKLVCLPSCCCSVTKSCPTLCNPMDRSTSGFPVHHQLLELAQTHVHWVSDAIQPSHPLSPPSPPAFNLSQHQGLF